MRKISIVISLLALCAACCRTEKGAPQAFDYKPGFKALKVDASRLDRIDALLQDHIDRGLLPNALTFVARDGQVIHHKAFGWSDVEGKTPLRTDNLFRMYSQTKAMTTVALMTLYERGLFQLDDPVSKYIPEMTDQVIESKVNDSVWVTRPAKSPVLIRHLLSHSAGINPKGGIDLVMANYPTLEEYVKRLVQQPLLYDPGTGYNYHPASDVWGYLVEYFSGKPLQEYLEEAIFEPLGIQDMAYYYDESYASRLVTMYRGDKTTGAINPVEMWSGRYPFGPETVFAAGGTGLYGTIEGYARFLQMVANGGTFNGRRILGRRTLEVMAQNQLAHPNGGGGNFCYGLGFEVCPEWDPAFGAMHKQTQMVNPGSLNWGGMANTDYLVDPKEGLIILLYTNLVPDPKVWEKFLNTVYQTLE